MAMTMRLALARLAVRHGIAAKPCSLPLFDPVDGPLDVEGLASTVDVDLDRARFRAYAFCNLSLFLKGYALPPLLYRHDETQVAGEIDSLTYDEHGNVRVRCTVTHEQAKRCGAFSIRAKILAYELRETETRDFHAVVTDAEIVEVSLTDCPANPRALVQHRHRAAPVDAYLNAVGESTALLIRRIEIAKQMAQLIQQTCHRALEKSVEQNCSTDRVTGADGKSYPAERTEAGDGGHQRQTSKTGSRLFVPARGQTARSI